MSKTWMIRSGELSNVVSASDQWEAWDTWRDEPPEKFGLIAIAEPNEDANPIPVQVATLMRRWGREVAALQFDDRAKELGLI